MGDAVVARYEPIVKAADDHPKDEPDHRRQANADQLVFQAEANERLVLDDDAERRGDNRAQQRRYQHAGDEQNGAVLDQAKRRQRASSTSDYEVALKIFRSIGMDPHPAHRTSVRKSKFTEASSLTFWTILATFSRARNDFMN